MPERPKPFRWRTFKLPNGTTAIGWEIKIDDLRGGYRQSGDSEGK
jgi:hypothetical protein